MADACSVKGAGGPAAPARVWGRGPAHEILTDECPFQELAHFWSSQEEEVDGGGAGGPH